MQSKSEVQYSMFFSNLCSISFRICFYNYCFIHLLLGVSISLHLYRYFYDVILAHYVYICLVFYTMFNIYHKRFIRLGHMYLATSGLIFLLLNLFFLKLTKIFRAISSLASLVSNFITFSLAV